MSLGCTTLSGPSPHRPPGCCLLGSAPHCLYSCRTWIRSRHSKEPALAQRESHLFTPTWTREALRKRSGIERFAGTRFSLLSSPLCGWSELALTSAASVSVGLAAEPTGLPDLIRSPKRVLAHLWEEDPQL